MSRVGEEIEDVLLLSLTGLESQNSQEDVVVQGSGLSRGDKRRNGKLGVLRELVAVGNAILGIDLAAEKQVLVLADHDSRRSQRIGVGDRPLVGDSGVVAAVPECAGLRRGENRVEAYSPRRLVAGAPW